MQIGLRGGEELAAISRQLRTMGNGREIKKQFTRELRTVARPMVPAVRASINAIPASSGASSGLRKRMAAATRLKVRTVGRQANVSVLVDPRKMPEHEKSLPAYMEGTKRNWRHPVYGRGVWVSQKPHPYFYKVVLPIGLRARSAAGRVIDGITRKIT